MKTYTTLSWYDGSFHSITLQGHWRLKAIMDYVKDRGGDLNFSFIRTYLGHKSYYEVKDGELSEVRPEHFLNYSITLQ